MIDAKPMTLLLVGVLLAPLDSGCQGSDVGGDGTDGGMQCVEGTALNVAQCAAECAAQTEAGGCGEVSSGWETPVDHDDFFHGCQWMEFFEVSEVTDAGCSYGEERGACAYYQGSEAGCATDAFCGESFYDAPVVSSFTEDGRVFVSLNPCGPSDQAGFDLCWWAPPDDYELHGAAECVCPCFPDFPGLD